MISDKAEVLSYVPESSTVGAFTYIDKDVVIGENVKIHPNVTIYSGVNIGNNVEIFPGAFIGKAPKGKALDTNNSYENRITIGDWVVIGPNAIIYLGDEIQDETMIGDGVSIRENCSIGKHCIIGRGTTINYATKIGNRVKIMDLSHVTAHSVLHDNVFVGPHCCMADDNGFGKDDTNAEFVGGPEIFENANLGEGVRLLPMVKIGANAIVGAGAVVTKDVMPDVTVMGVPAKIIK